MRWVIWAFAALFYFYEYLLRVSPSTMVPELMAVYSLNAAEIGALGGAFFFSYAPMQIPVGVLMDRFGAKTLLTYASIACGAGALIFGIAKFLPLAYLSRILIGAGASFGFVAMVYVCSHWFEASKRALLVGVANSIAMLGGLVGEGPLSSTVKAIGWRWTMIFLGLIGFILGLLIYFSFSNRRKKKMGWTEEKLETQKPGTLLKGIRLVSTSGHSWLNAFVALLYYMPTSALTGLWGIAFLQTAHGLSKVVAGYAISMLFFGWLSGGPITGAISDRLGRKKIIILSILLTFCAQWPIIYFLNLPVYVLYILFFLVGFFSSSQLLNFTFATEIMPHDIKGVAIACTNFIVAVGSAAILPLIGFLLDFNSNTLRHPGVPTYSRQNYEFALSSLVICLGLAFIFSLFLSEKRRGFYKKDET